MYDAVEVAWKMLKEARKQGKTLSNLQLQKLVYIAHGYLLAWKDKKLVNDSISAWKYGPVIDPIYHEFKEFGSDKIATEKLGELPTRLDGDEDACSVIQGVLKLYGDRSAMDLVNLTHQEDTPWDEIWNRKGGRSQLNARIPNEVIKNHYRKVISNPKQVSGL